MSEEASVAVASVLGRVTAEDDLLRHRELPGTRGGLRVADASFGRVDPDQPDPLRLATRQPDVERVSVDVRVTVPRYVNAPVTAAGLPALPGGDRRQRSQSEQKRSQFYACCGRLAPLSKKHKPRRGTGVS